MAFPKGDPAELVILSLLAEGPTYGYAISKEVAARSDGRLKLGPGVLYPLLKRLEAEGLVSTSWEEIKAPGSEDDAVGRRRKWYKLSAKGRKTLDRQIAAHRAYRTLLDAFVGTRKPGEAGS